jgi:phospholipid-binding lipoprotein MlaA
VKSTGVKAPKAWAGRARRLMAASGLVLAVLAAGCATAPAPATISTGAPATMATAAMGQNPADPWERLNRKIFAFNDAVDEALLKPLATAWRDTVPATMRRGVSNFFGNVNDIWSTANHFLQGKAQSGLDMGLRVTVNTLVGLGGVLDPASEMKLDRRSEDFGQTLATWGVGDGPFVVLPIFGPSTLRDAVVFPVDNYFTSAPNYFTHLNGYLASPLYVVNLRAELLATTSLLGDVSLDRYAFVRDAYLARRLDQVYDGAPPLAPLESDDPEAPPKKK